MRRKSSVGHPRLTKPFITAIATFLLTIFLWNRQRLLSHIPAFLTTKPIMASVCSSIPLFGPPTTAQVFILSGKTSINGYHFDQSLKIRMVERERVDWEDCRFIVRWLMPKDVIVDVSQLDRDAGHVKRGGVRAYTRWTTSRPVDLELPAYSLDTSNPFLLEAHMTFGHSQWQSSNFEVKYDVLLHLSNALIRYQRPDGVATSQHIPIPQPTFDFTCTTRIVVIDIFGKKAYELSREAEIPVAHIVEAMSLRITPALAMTITIGVSMLGALAICLA